MRDRNARAREVPPRTLPAISLAALNAGRMLYPVVDVERPQTRADCVSGPRPCPFVACRHHLYLDVTFAGSVKLNFPDLDVEQMPVSCSLDVADDHHVRSIEQVGPFLNVTRGRVQQLEKSAKQRLKKLHPKLLAELLAHWATAPGFFDATPFDDVPRGPLRRRRHLRVVR